MIPLECDEGTDAGEDEGSTEHAQHANHDSSCAIVRRGCRGIADCCRDLGARQLVRAREGHDFFQRAAAGVHVSAGHR